MLKKYIIFMPAVIAFIGLFAFFVCLPAAQPIILQAS